MMNSTPEFRSRATRHVVIESKYEMFDVMVYLFGFRGVESDV